MRKETDSAPSETQVVTRYLRSVERIVEGTRGKISRRKVRFILVLVLVASAVAVYLNTLSCGFVFDDDHQVLNNRWILDAKYIPDIFSKGVWDFRVDVIKQNYYRPMMHLVYMGSYHIFGLDPRGFHLVNILFHVGVTILVFAVTSLLMKSRASGPRQPLAIPFTAALLFATHPVHTEVVSWIAAIPDLTVTFFSLLSLYFYMKTAVDDFSYNHFYVFSLVCFFIATLCKETALTLPVIMIGYDYALKGRQSQRNGSLFKYIPYVALGGIYLMLRVNALGGFAPAGQHKDLSNYEYVINVFPLFAQYLEKLIFPIHLNAFYVFHPIVSIWSARGLLALTATAVFAVLLAASFRKERVVFFSLLLILVPLLPVFYIRGLQLNVFAERYLYFPSVGFVILVSMIFTRTGSNKPGLTAGFVSIIIVITGLYSVETVKRNVVWANDFTLFSDMVEKSPDGAVPHSLLGWSLFLQGQTNEAIEHLQTSVNLDWTDSYTHYYLARAYYEEGLIDRAIEEYRMALALKRNNEKAHTALGMACAKRGFTDEAIQEYLIALTIAPDDATAHNHLGIAYAKKGLLDESLHHLRAAVRLSPNYADAYHNLGMTYEMKGFTDSATASFETAVRLSPSNFLYRYHLERSRATQRKHGG